MNMSIQNGISVVTSKGKVFIDDEEISLPEGMKTGSQSVINGNVYIDGYEYFPKTKSFKKTLKALFYKYF